MSSSKKKKRPSAGEDLINSLFDDISSKSSATSKARSKTTEEVNRLFGSKDDAPSEQDHFTPIPDISAKLVAEDKGESEEPSLELAAPGKHDKLDPFEEFKRKRAATTKISSGEKLNQGSIPTIDLEKLENEESDEVVDLSGVMQAPKQPAAKAPFAGGQPVVTQMASRPEPTYEDGEAEELADFTSSEPEASNWSSDYGAISAPDDFAPIEHLNTEQPELVAETQVPQVPVEPVYEPEAISMPQMPAPVEFQPEASAPEAPADEERTMRLVVSQKEAPKAPFDPMPVEPKAAQSRSFNRSDATEIRAGIKVPPAPKLEPIASSQNAFTSSEAQLKQSESLRIAQNRISELERELERLRRDNEALSTAGDTLRRRGDELLTKTEALEIKAREAAHLLEEERRIMRGQLQAKDRDNAEMRARVEEIETRLESNFKKIRVRERELEHRLEIVKMESATLVSTKDKMILDLKRQIDQLTHESDYAKTKTQELFNQYKDKQETQRRVVRALRIALTILEGDDETVVPLKKAE